MPPTAMPLMFSPPCRCQYAAYCHAATAYDDATPDFRLMADAADTPLPRYYAADDAMIFADYRR